MSSSDAQTIRDLTLQLADLTLQLADKEAHNKNLKQYAKELRELAAGRAAEVLEVAAENVELRLCLAVSEDRVQELARELDQLNAAALGP